MVLVVCFDRLSIYLTSNEAPTWEQEKIVLEKEKKMIVVPLYILTILTILLYKTILLFSSLFEIRFKLYKWTLGIIIIFALLSESEILAILIFLFGVFLIFEVEIVTIITTAIKDRVKISNHKIYLLTLFSAIFILLISNEQRDISLFLVIFVIPISLFYSIVMMILHEYFKINIFIVSLLGLLSIYFFSFPSIWINLILAGGVGVLPMISYYVFLPSFSKSKLEYLLKHLIYMILIELLFQVFLFFSANLAYSEALKLNIQNKPISDFYDGTLKEIYIDDNTRWSYHRFKYVNEWK